MRRYCNLLLPVLPVKTIRLRRFQQGNQGMQISNPGKKIPVPFEKLFPDNDKLTDNLRPLINPKYAIWDNRFQPCFILYNH